MRILTIGYAGATRAGLVAALRAAGVERLADIRAAPIEAVMPGASVTHLFA